MARYTNAIAWEILRELDFSYPDDPVLKKFEPLIEALAADRPVEEVERISRSVTKAAWGIELESDAQLVLRAAHYFAKEYVSHLESALADLERRGATSMTARAIVDSLALDLAAERVSESDGA